MIRDNAAVKTLYESWPYPKRNPEEDRTRLLRPPMEALARINHYGWYGRRHIGADAPPLRMLTAGAGTGDPTIYLAEQLKDTQSEVVWVDQSSASLEIAKKRAEIRGLDNISWHLMPLEALVDRPDIVKDGFDYINCCGVLHHLENPEVGLAALTSALAEGGVMGVTVYARYGRTPVHHMKDLLSMILDTDEPTDSKMEIVRSILADGLTDLSKNMSDELRESLQTNDIELADFLLHPREVSYSVDEFYDLVESAGLELISFTGFFDGGGVNKSFYQPSSYIKDAKLLERLSALPTRRQHAICEILHGNIGLHCAYIGKTARALATPEVRDLIPWYFAQPDVELAEVFQRHEGLMIEISDTAGNAITLPAVPGLADLFSQFDNERTVSDLIAEAARIPIIEDQARKMNVPAPTLAKANIDSVFEAMNRFDWLLLARNPSLYSPSSDQRLSAIPLSTA